ncbi:MAG: COG4315 family predicted lipoprotein [Gaiellaceae bacterium]
MRLWLSLAVLTALAAGLVLSAPTGAGTTATRAVVETTYNKKLKKRIVVDGSGRTLYMFTADTGGTPTCTPTGVGPDCVKLWPPLKSRRKPSAGTGIVASKLKVVKRSDGIWQAVYNHHPLYHYSGDKKPGDLRGQKFEGLWYVLSPKGVPIKK